MSLIVGENLREPWSPITDSRILRPRDELKLVGATGFVATVAILDSHNPLATLGPDFRENGKAPLAEHHHMLMQVDGGEELWPAGMYVGEGPPEELIFLHRPQRLFNDAVHEQRLWRLDVLLALGNHGLYYASGNERLSATPLGRVHVNAQGGLLM
ncbi:MAG TPA: hypothetical protein VLF71_05510 [Candidatus Saccharimonadales bacterium]|nr:hypothetical protein [Candidatus Saccharimonadales bacterium]